MKAFEKHDTDYCSNPNTKCPSGNGCSDCISKRKEGWKAALKCVLAQMNEDKFKDNGELRTFIDGELGYCDE